MQQYRIEFFENYVSSTTSSRGLRFVHNDFANDLTVDDDYIALQTTTIEIRATDKVKAGHLIRILRDDTDYFFGLVADAEPGEYTTRISFKPFLAIFDSNILFDVRTQRAKGTDGTIVRTGITLEETLKFYIDGYFVNNDDYKQVYPMSVSIPELVANRTADWNMNIQPESDESNLATIGLYNTLIVRAMKEYGVAITVTPNFSTGQIALEIGKVSGTKHIDADLENVKIKTFKVNDKPNGINKLVIYNTLTYNDPNDTPIIYYVHPDRSFNTNDVDRITPVAYEIRTVTPSVDEPFNNLADNFAYEALSTAWEELSGLQFDNLIELEVAPNDPIISPTTMKNGQMVIIHHNGTAYSSILTGKAVSLEVITLMFGSERITYTKKTSK